MCLSILGLPSKFLAGPVNRVFYKEATERYNNGENIGELSYNILNANIKIAIIPITILIIFGEHLFTAILGSKWSEAGTFASYLGIYQLMSFFNSCLAGKFIIIQKNRTILWLNAFSVFLYSGIFLICHEFRLKAVNTIAIFALFGALFEMVDTLIFMAQTKASLKKYLRFVLVYLLVPIVLATSIRMVLFS